MIPFFQPSQATIVKTCFLEVLFSSLEEVWYGNLGVVDDNGDNALDEDDSDMDDDLMSGSSF